MLPRGQTSEVQDTRRSHAQGIRTGISYNSSVASWQTGTHAHVALVRDSQKTTLQ